MRAFREMIALHKGNFMYLPVILQVLIHSSLIADTAFWINRTRLCLAQGHDGI